MTNFDKLLEEPFLKTILLENMEFENRDRKNDKNFDLLNYLNDSFFYTIHLMTLYDQLQNSIEFLSNYRYNKKDEIGRGKHLVYNVENYIIRITSVSDRMLQMINAIFNLGINEKDVKERLVLNNSKVIKTNIPEHFKNFKKILIDFTGDRNAIIHRHSYINEELFRLEKFYNPTIVEHYFMKASPEEQEKFKFIRQQTLTNFIKKTKSDFKEVNELCFERTIPIFKVLESEFSKQKSILK